MAEMNSIYEVDNYCPDYINIGDDSGGRALLLKQRKFNDNSVYIVDHGAMTPESMEVITDDMITWLAAGCPLPDDD